MRTRHPIVNRLAIVTAVLGIALLGNLRSHAAESSSSNVISMDAKNAQRTGFGTLRVSDGDPSRGIGSDADEVVTDKSLLAADLDDGHLVPAIYAWDPDVRFVYYRHVSKWM